MHGKQYLKAKCAMPIVGKSASWAPMHSQRWNAEDARSWHSRLQYTLREHRLQLYGIDPFYTLRHRHKTPLIYS